MLRERAQSVQHLGIVLPGFFGLAWLVGQPGARRVLGGIVLAAIAVTSLIAGVVDVEPRRSRCPHAPARARRRLRPVERRAPRTTVRRRVRSHRRGLVRCRVGRPTLRLDLCGCRAAGRPRARRRPPAGDDRRGRSLVVVGLEGRLAGFPHRAGCGVAGRPLRARRGQRASQPRMEGVDDDGPRADSPAGRSPPGPIRTAIRGLSPTSEMRTTQLRRQSTPTAVCSSRREHAR